LESKRIVAAGGLLIAAALALVVWTSSAYPPVTTAMVALSLGLAGASLWSSRVLLGTRSTWIFVALAVPLGWFAEQMGSTRGWFFGSYTYTDVLGPKVGSVPLVIPFMWFGLCQIGLAMACLVLWRQPVPPPGTWKTRALAALAAAMIVTAFDLGADPFFVYQLKAWIMTEKDGDWFGETVRGFEGWMMVSFAIVVLFLAIARPAATPGASGASARRAAVLPIGAYAFMMAFQVAIAEPVALRVIAFFAMGLPVLFALVAWHHWSRVSTEGAA
jgi:uncharacterized membrane protein